MEDADIFDLINTGSSPKNAVEITTEAEPPGENILYVADTVEVANTDDSIICLDEEETLTDLLPNEDTPLNLSTTSLPVVDFPFTSDDPESSSLNHSNDNDDEEFFIVFEKKAPPPEVQVLENYKSPNTHSKKKQRKSQNPRPSDQSAYHNVSQQEVTEPADPSLDESVSITFDGTSRIAHVTPSVNRNNILNSLQQSAADSVEKKKRKIECGVCFDGPDEIEASGRSVVSTVCGHIFCSDCMKTSIKSCKHCPQCRKKLTMKQFHVIYV